jgi:hypothetical protein
MLPRMRVDANGGTYDGKMILIEVVSTSLTVVDIFILSLSRFC